MRAYDGCVLSLTDHIKRLNASANTLGLEGLPSVKKMKVWIQEALKDSAMSNSMIRVSAQWMSSKRNHSRPKLQCMIRPFNGHPSEWYRRGVAVRTSSVVSSAIKEGTYSIKANNYMLGIMTQLASTNEKVVPLYDLLLLNSSQYLTEGTISNFFVYKNECLWTPPAACGILLGITRAIVVEAAKNLNIPVRETNLTRHDLYCSQEVFLTNTSSEILPVIMCDNRRVHNGRPGKTFKKLRNEVGILIKNKCKG